MKIRTATLSLLMLFTFPVFSNAGEQDIGAVELTEVFSNKLSSNAIVYRVSNNAESNMFSETNGSGFGFSFQGKKLLMTNNHVIGSEDICEKTRIAFNFNYYTRIASASHADLKSLAVLENSMYNENNYDSHTRFFLKGLLPLLTGDSPVYRCKRIVVTNPILDFSVIEVEGPIFPQAELDLAQKTIHNVVDLVKIKTGHSINFNTLESLPLENQFGNVTAASLNHSLGRSLRAHLGCSLEITTERGGFHVVPEGYNLFSNCEIYGGASGSFIYDLTSGKPLALLHSGEKDESYFKGADTAYALYLPLILPKLFEYLISEDESIGFYSFDGAIWTSVDGAVQIKYYNHSRVISTPYELVEKSKGVEKLRDVVRNFQKLYQNAILKKPETRIQISLVDLYGVDEINEPVAFMSAGENESKITDRLISIFNND